MGPCCQTEPREQGSHRVRVHVGVDHAVVITFGPLSQWPRQPQRPDRHRPGGVLIACFQRRPTSTAFPRAWCLIAISSSRNCAMGREAGELRRLARHRRRGGRGVHPHRANARRSGLGAGASSHIPAANPIRIIRGIVRAQPRHHIVPAAFSPFALSVLDFAKCTAGPKSQS